jgi:hypothetical protein
MSEKIQKIKSNEFKFGDLKTAQNNFSFRFWNQGQVIEIEKESDSIITGNIINFVTESSDSQKTQRKIQNGEIIPNIYFQKIELNKQDAEKILKIIVESKILNLKTSDSIKDWKPILDGEWFKIEQKINGEYVEKNYVNPKSQEELLEAKVFLNFYSELEKKLSLEIIFQNFFKRLKQGCYSRNGEYEIICKRKK